jgi:hypothetical protein
MAYIEYITPDKRMRAGLGLSLVLLLSYMNGFAQIEQKRSWVVLAESDRAWY